MTTSSFRLDSVVADLLHGLEHERGALAARHKEPRALAAALRKALEEHLSLKEREYRAWGMWEEETWRLIEREAIEVVFPQYTSYAVAQTELERRDYRIWRGGDVFSRIVYALAGVMVSAAILRFPEAPRLLEQPLALVLILGAPFLPELQRFYFRWTHARRLNRLIREAGRQQALIERYALVDALEQVGQGMTAGRPPAAPTPAVSGEPADESAPKPPPAASRGGGGESIH